MVVVVDMLSEAGVVDGGKSVLGVRQQPVGDGGGRRATIDRSHHVKGGRDARWR